MATITPQELGQALEAIRNCVCASIAQCPTLDCNFMLAIMLTENDTLDKNARNRNPRNGRFGSFDAGLMQINTTVALALGERPGSCCVAGMTKQRGESKEVFHARVATALEDIQTNICCVCELLKEAIGANALNCPSTDILAAAYNAGWPAIKKEIKAAKKEGREIRIPNQAYVDRFRPRLRKVQALDIPCCPPPENMSEEYLTTLLQRLLAP